MPSAIISIFTINGNYYYLGQVYVLTAKNLKKVEIPNSQAKIAKKSDRADGVDNSEVVPMVVCEKIVKC